MRRFILLSICLFINGATASEYATQQHKAALESLRTTSPSSLPGFVTDNPKETSLNNIGALESAVTTATETNKTAGDFKKIAETRPYFTVDLEKDPQIRDAQKIAKNPKDVLDGKMRFPKRSVTYTYKTCQESKPGTEYTCSKSLLTPQIHIEPAKYAHHWCAMGNHQPDDPRCGAKTYYNPARMYKPEVVTVTKEQWTTTCQTLEQKQKAGVCRLIRTVCPKGRETREIPASIGETGKIDLRPITKDCWRYEHVYECSSPSENTCKALRESECAQIGSKCIRKIGEECVEWEQTYRCAQEQKEFEEESSETLSSKPFQLPQVETPLSSPPNPDMHDALSKLSILQEVQKEMRAQPTVETVTVFKGQDKRCTIAFANFKNCCTGKGWGMSMSLSSCDGEEKDLAERQAKSLCVEVGTYCAEKIPVIGCIRKKRSHCCFPSRLSRILHEQGRRQLNMGWGDGENPNCRGFTPEELSRINFDQLDLREVFEEIQSRTKEISSEIVQRNLGNRVTEMTKGFGKNNSKSGEY